jgi:hypothetical protein
MSIILFWSFAHWVVCVYFVRSPHAKPLSSPRTCSHVCMLFPAFYMCLSHAVDLPNVKMLILPQACSQVPARDICAGQRL